jgi:hypothetical protein
VLHNGSERARRAKVNRNFFKRRAEDTGPRAPARGVTHEKGTERVELVAT